MIIGMMRRAVVAGLLASGFGATAQPFTYQGMLNDGGSPADGVYDLRVTLLNEGGETVAGPISFNDISIANGVFSVELDFGAGAFDGNGRLLGLEFRAGASTGGFTDLLPNTPINPTPYALYALNAASLVTQEGSVIRIGEGIGSDVAIVNPAMPDGQRVNLATYFQVNFSSPGYGGMYVRGSDASALPFYGFATPTAIGAYIDYQSSSDQIRFWDGDAFAPTATMSTTEVVVGPDLLVGGDIRVNTGSVIRPEVGSVVSVTGTLSASQEIRSTFDTVVGDDLEVDDQIVKDYGTNQYSNAIPVAYGSFLASGNSDGVTANISALWDASLSRYVVTISGFNATSNPNVINVTPLGSTPRFATASTVSGNVLVYIHDLNGNRVQAPFGIVVYDASQPFTRNPGN